MTTWDLILSGGAIITAVAFLYAATTRPPKPRRAETGATIGWSPKQEEADASADQLTPTGQLEREPAAVLDDGTVCGRRGLPSWEALSTDTHHALDPAWEAMLAEFGNAMDESAAEFDARMDEIEADFHRRRDNMAQVEAEHAALIARLATEKDGLGLWVGAR